MKRLPRTLAVVGVLAVSVLGAARLWLEAGVAPLGGREAVAGLADSVVILWDSLAVPHILASAEEDLFAAIGYVHARDRMFQMDLLRHAAEGRLSELFGERTVASDRALRELELGRIARARWAKAGVEARRAARAYAVGVTAWLARDHRALEFRLLGHAPEPWRPEHTIAVGLLQAWDLRSSGDELAFAQAVARLGPERASALLPEYPDTAPVIVGTAQAAARHLPLKGSGLRAPEEVLGLPTDAEQRVHSLLPHRGAPAASNSWVLGPSRTASGKPILANDPHLTLRAPSTWYLVGAHAPGYEVVGATIPGIPAVVLGHNARIAWGLTNVLVDDVDYVIEELSADSTRYRTATGWAPVETVAETLRVRGGASLVYRRHRTAHGPVVETGRTPDSGRVPVLRWVAQDSPSDEVSALVRMGRARDYESFASAITGFRSPEQNVVYADADGNIAYFLAGHVPVRLRGDGTLPTAGWTEEGRWLRYLSAAELPRALNPPGGVIVTANNRVAGQDYPFFISRHWELPYRAQRILELVGADRAATAASVARHQLDVVDPFARAVKSLAGRAALAAGRADLADRLRGWDGAMAADRLEPGLFWSWYRELQGLTYADESPAYRPAAPLHRWIAAGASPWFDDVRTAEREDLPALARRAMENVLGRGALRPWGDVHHTVQEHPLGSVPVLGRLIPFDIGPLATGGGDYTVNVSPSAGRSPPFQSDYGPSLRHVVDFGAVDRVGGFILPAGQSGHPFSPHYRDQTERWLKGELWILPLALSEVRARDTLVLVP